MRLGLFVNDVATEVANYTTTRIAVAAIERGHEVWYIGAGDFTYDPDGHVYANACAPGADPSCTLDEFLDDVKTTERARIPVTALDCLLLRSDPSAEGEGREWARYAGVHFGMIAATQGVVVLNDPWGLASATNKLYLQRFPEEVRPRSLVSRDRDEVREFIDSEPGDAVLKPLQGSGGENVFLVRKGEQENVNQIIEAISRSGYVIAQEYLPAAAEGDTRLILVDGGPLVREGRYCAVGRVRTGGDLRSNVSAGGEIAPAEVDDDMVRIAEIVRPRLVEDGMFLVGLDVAGDKIMEVNVFSPGGLGMAGMIEEVDFTGPVLDALERKVQHQKQYRRTLENRRVATSL